MKKDIVKVRMLGNFFAFYGGKDLLSRIGKNTQFAGLMQLLWYYREKGVDRRLLMEALMDGREPQDAAHALQCSLYNAKRKLRDMGLPECDYIIKKKGRYFWNFKIPVETDVDAFDSLIKKASEETGREEKRRLLLEVCYLYQGDFLNGCLGGLWIVSVAREYRENFRRCVEETAAILREDKNYQELWKLGEHAARVDIGSEWEELSMEALYMLGKVEEGQKLYAKTVDLYRKECGASPSPKLKMYLSKMDNQKTYKYRMLDEIQESLEEAEAEGGYVCSPSAFQNVYQIIQRISERGGQSVCLMACTLLDEKDRQVRDEKALDEVSDDVCAVLRHSVRHSDTISRYGLDIYLVLLVNICLEDCEIIQQRINEGLREKNISFHVSYSMANLIPQRDIYA